MRNPEIGQYVDPDTFKLEYRVKVMTDDGPRIVRGDEPGIPDDVRACLDKIKRMSRVVTIGRPASVAQAPVRILIPEPLLLRMEEKHDTAPEDVVKDLAAVLNAFDWNNNSNPSSPVEDVAFLDVFITPELVADLKSICGLDPMVEIAHIIWGEMHA